MGGPDGTEYRRSTSSRGARDDDNFFDDDWSEAPPRSTSNPSDGRPLIRPEPLAARRAERGHADGVPSQDMDGRVPGSHDAGRGVDSLERPTGVSGVNARASRTDGPDADQPGRYQTGTDQPEHRHADGSGWLSGAPAQGRHDAAPVVASDQSELETGELDVTGGERRTIAINDGELGERIAGSSVGGEWRPAVSPNNLAAIDDAPDAPPAYLAVDLGITRLSAGIVSTDGELVVRDRVATPQRSVWPAVTQLVHRVIAANKTELRPRWCGVTCPGPIDQEAGVMMPIGLPVWKDFPLRDELSRHVGLPVAIDTHGRGLALAEQWLGVAKDLPTRDQNFATLVIADEISGGLVESGVLKNGKTGNLGGFGHICVEPEGLACPCGGTGCLVMYASVGSIESDTGRDLPRTPPAIVERSAIMVGRAVASIAAMLDVSEVVVAGVVAQVLGQPFYDALDAELNDRSRLRHLEQLTVRAASSALGPLVSAAAIARTLVDETDASVAHGIRARSGSRVG